MGRGRGGGVGDGVCLCVYRILKSAGCWVDLVAHTEGGGCLFVIGTGWIYSTVQIVVRHLA